MTEKKTDKAYDAEFSYEKNFGGCAQCCIGALYEIFPELSDESVFRAASGLGGGSGLSGPGL